jgi:hypothetical protein
MNADLKRPAGEHPDPEHWAALCEQAVAATPYCRAWRAHSVEVRPDRRILDRKVLDAGYQLLATIPERYQLGTISTKDGARRDVRP